MTRLEVLCVLVILNVLWAISFWALYVITNRGIEAINATPLPAVHSVHAAAFVEKADR